MSDTRSKLAALPKPALVDLALRLGVERNQARSEAEAARASAKAWKTQAGRLHDYHSWTARQVRDLAQAELDGTAPNPAAGRNLDTLADELEAFDQRRRNIAALPRTRKPGPRCHKGRGAPCMKPLDDDGLCSRHDARARRARKEAA